MLQGCICKEKETEERNIKRKKETTHIPLDTSVGIADVLSRRVFRAAAVELEAELPAVVLAVRHAFFFSLFLLVLSRIRGGLGVYIYISIWYVTV